MNNLYRKVAVTSVGIALGFALGANKEAKAATIILPPTIQFGINGQHDHSSNVSSGELSSQYDRVSKESVSLLNLYTARVAEFSINSFFPTPNTIIKSAVFQDRISRFGKASSIGLSIWGYAGNGIPEASDAWQSISYFGPYLSSWSPGDTINFDVTEFVNSPAIRNNGFVGFLLTPGFPGELTLEGNDAFGRSSLVIETADVAEPVPEPTTIFGSAIGLCLGGWLKRKKLSQQSKTAPQR